MFYTHFIQVITAQVRDRIGIECIRKKHTKPVLYLSRVRFFSDKKEILHQVLCKIDAAVYKSKNGLNVFLIGPF